MCDVVNHYYPCGPLVGDYPLNFEPRTSFVNRAININFTNKNIATLTDARAFGATTQSRLCGAFNLCSMHAVVHSTDPKLVAH